MGDKFQTDDVISTTRRKYLLGGLGAMALSGCVGGPDTGQSDTTNNTSSEETEPQLEETHSLGSLDITAYDAFYVQSVSSEEGFIEEHPEGIFTVVRLTLRNTGSKPLDISTEWFQLLDEDNQTYAVDTDAVLTVSTGLGYETLQPNLEMNRDIIFDVPQNDEMFWTLRVVEASLFDDSPPSQSIPLGELRHWSD